MRPSWKVVRSRSSINKCCKNERKLVNRNKSINSSYRHPEKKISASETGPGI